MYLYYLNCDNDNESLHQQRKKITCNYILSITVNYNKKNYKKLLYYYKKKNILV